MENIAVGASAVALLNAVREAMAGNWKPLLWTLAAGAVALLVSWLIGEPDLKMAFVLGLGGSGIYTLSTKMGSSPVTGE